MKRLNHIFATATLILFLIHALAGVVTLTGLSYVSLKWLSYLLMGVMLVHTVMSLVFTIPALRSGARSGKWYLGANAVFWIKRISGIAILLMTFFHMNTYTATVDGVFSLKEFTLLRLISQLTFAAVIFLHIFISIKGYLLNKGIKKIRQGTLITCLIFSCLLLVIAVAYVIYYWHWMTGVYG